MIHKGWPAGRFLFAALWMAVLGGSAGLPSVRADSASDVAREMAVLQAQAESGDAEAQYNLATVYKDGVIVPLDYDLALVWFRKSAEQGYDGAQLALGTMYEGGHGVPRDLEEAAKWYRLAAEQGNGWAATFLNAITSPDSTDTFYLLNRAEEGDAEAQVAVGDRFLHGASDVKPDREQAEAWYRRAADQGNAQAQERLRALDGDAAPAKETPAAVPYEPPTAAPPATSPSDEPPM